MNNEPVYEETRQERREKRVQKKRRRMSKHGGGLAKIYRDAILKRLKRRRLTNGEERSKKERLTERR